MREVGPFRTAYMTRFGNFDSEPLLDYCRRVRFLSTTKDFRPESLVGEICTSLTNFDPEYDLLVPAGNLSVAMVTGVLAATMSDVDSVFYMAVYHDKRYSFLCFHRSGFAEAVQPRLVERMLAI